MSSWHLNKTVGVSRERCGGAGYLSINRLSLLPNYVEQTSKKDRLSTAPYRLPRLQEIVVPVAIANIMIQHAERNQN
jgi:hypothetical protein